ncbi:flagellar hook-basal body protein [Candidatus Thiodiazotropha sp. CDECU1]|uniref:flagellar hook-basal body protein n=1 Tax=Candidatus Thiodiazotropha sp. CDECU1 TaxID=3065865 RepID=UPI00292E5640|nr:flagellar hook-basal body protein [Candidatus Thiodiazotropha sp. CDECU1]
MGSALTITEASLINGMRHLDIIGHNLANADTVGYKREMAVSRPFSSYFLQAGAISSRGDHPGITKATDFTIGTSRHTGNPLDLAIEGDGYFVIDSPQGKLYTRQGNFMLDAAGYLVMADGHRIAGEGGALRLISDQPRIDKEGVVWEAGERVGRLDIARFSDSRQLEKLGSGLFRAGTAVALPETSMGPGLRQGFIETSNVNGMDEMVDLIATMRQLEGAQKVVRGYNEMLDLAIQTIADI